MSAAHARKLLDDHHGDVAQAAEAYLLTGTITHDGGSCGGALDDSSVEQMFRRDQYNAKTEAEGCTADIDDDEDDEDEDDRDMAEACRSSVPLVLDFGRSKGGVGSDSSPLVVKAEPSHRLAVHVEGDTVCCRWDVASGLPVEGVALCPHGAPEGRCVVARTAVDPRSAAGFRGTARFEHTARGLYDVRLYGRGRPTLPVCVSDGAVRVGPPAPALCATVHDGNVVRITLGGDGGGGDGTAVPVDARDWIGAFDAAERDNTVLCARDARCSCAAAVDGTLELHLPRRAGRYELRYFDARSREGVCCGVSPVIVFEPRDTVAALAYSAATGTLRVRWACAASAPTRWAWVGLFADSAQGARARRLAWDWCSSGVCSARGDHGLVDLALPAALAAPLRARSTPGAAAAWAAQDLALRLYSSSVPSVLVATCALPTVPPEPASSSRPSSV